MLIKGLQKLTLLDYPGKIACTTAFPKIGEGGPQGFSERSVVEFRGFAMAVDEDDHFEFRISNFEFRI